MSVKFSHFGNSVLQDGAYLEGMSVKRLKKPAGTSFETMLDKS
jgi:hypothetical protein